MRVLIVEDEELAARMLKGVLVELLGSRLDSIQIQTSLIGSGCYLWDHPVDLMFLDLDLGGSDGFELLKSAAAGSFHTIVVSAHTERALEAFEYGVLDFVPKPYSRERMAKALTHYSSGPSARHLRYLSIPGEGRISLVPLETVCYLEACDKRTQVTRKDGQTFLCNKMLRDLERMLPAGYMRVHRSFIVNLAEIREIRERSDRRYALTMKNGRTLPVSRSTYPQLLEKIG
jgi:two-component system response regulator LytT